MQLLQACMALVFVLGLLFITLWLIKLCQQKGICRCFEKKLGTAKVKILEQRRIDIKNTLVLIEYRQQEILLLLGANNSTVIDRQPLQIQKDDNKHG